MPEQALGWLPLGLGLVVEDEPSELAYVSCSSFKLLGSWKILCLEVEKSGMYEASIVVKVLYIDGNNWNS